MSHSSDTIFALSSGMLPAGVAIFRISGGKALAVSKALVGELPTPRQASLRTFRIRNEFVLDQGLVVVFPGPASFTGEDCVEFHLHGSKAVAQALLEELAGFDGCRMAEPGEFSRRALENGRMDLVEIEGLADLLAAETDMQRRLAVEQSTGNLSALYRGWADRITRSRALIEAELDFADEEDVPGSVSDQIWAGLRSVADEMERHLQGAAFGEIVREGLKIVIAGEPNAGKSSLMNALARREIAIVTDIAGTTRDVLHVDLNIDGYAVKLYDTAGLRETAEMIEQEGIRRALRTIRDADLVLSLAEIGTEPRLTFDDFAGRVIAIGTKLDLHGPDARYDLCISSASGEGLQALHRCLVDDLARRSSGLPLALPARRRHKDLLQATLGDLHLANGATDSGLDIRAEYLRLASQSLGRITGHVDVEDLLDVIFSEFCIGK